MRAFVVPMLVLGVLAWSVAAQGAIAPADARARVATTLDEVYNLENDVVDTRYHEGDWAKAIDALERQIVLDPTDIEPYKLVAWLNWTRDNARVLATYDRMIAAAPENPWAYFEVGQYYVVNQRNHVEAERWLKQAVDRGLPSPERRTYGHTLTRLGRNDDALAFWRKILADDPNDEVAKQQIEKLTAPPPAAPPKVEAPAPAG